jgi:5,10-methylenetetrahydromethanopterin reductase
VSSRSASELTISGDPRLTPVGQRDYTEAIVLRFGAGLLGHYSRRYPVARVADLAALCERLGFDSWWVADQRWMRDVWVSLTASAQRTSSILLGSRVTDPYIRHPALTAVAIASLDELSGGRAVLGIGAGGSGFQQLGIERRKPVVAVREMIELIRRLLAGGEVEYAGELISFRRGGLEFGTRADIPIVLVARGPRLLELGGRLAEGVMVASMASPAAVRWGIEHVALGAASAGRPLAAVELSSMLYTSISNDGAAARHIVRRGIAAALLGSFPNLDFVTASGLAVPPELEALLAARRPDYPRLMAAIPDAFVDHLALAGTPAQCAVQIERLVEAGIRHVVLAPLPVDETDVEAVIVPFAEEVIPRVRAAGIPA